MLYPSLLAPPSIVLAIIIMGAVKTQLRTDKDSLPQPKIWWSNTVFFLTVHFAAAVGVYYKPPTAVPWATLLLFIAVWRLAVFG